MGLSLLPRDELVSAPVPVYQLFPLPTRFYRYLQAVHIHDGRYPHDGLELV